MMGAWQGQSLSWAQHVLKPIFKGYHSKQERVLWRKEDEAEIMQLRPGA